MKIKLTIIIILYYIILYYIILYYIILYYIILYYIILYYIILYYVMLYYTGCKYIHVCTVSRILSGPQFFIFALGDTCKNVSIQVLI